MADTEARIFGDHLHRIQLVENIAQIVQSCAMAGTPTAFSIEGEWGKGKTWVY